MSSIIRCKMPLALSGLRTDPGVQCGCALYHQFVTEHIAGDLLPEPRRNPVDGFNESVIGTGFFWLEQRVHSPVDVRQDEADVIDNQIDVLSKTFLGLTVACARCHDHKFDAIAAKDFYSLYGVLESSHYAQQAVNSAAQITPKVKKLRQIKEQIRREAASTWLKESDEIAKYLMAVNMALIQTNADHAGGDLDPDRLSQWTKALKDKSVSEPGHPLYAWMKLSGSDTNAGSDSFPARWDALVRESFQNSSNNPGTNYELFADLSAPDCQGWFPDGDAFTAGSGGMGDFIIGDTNHPFAAILHEPAVNDAVVSRRLEGALRSRTFEIQRRYVHVRAAGQDARIKVCVENLTMIRDPIYGGLKKYLASDTPVWTTFDLEMWRGHEAYIELCDVSTADNGDERQRDGSNAKGYIAASQVLFSDQSAPPAAAHPPQWLFLLGREPVDSLPVLARRYQTAFEQAVQTWSVSSSPSSLDEGTGERHARSDAPDLRKVGADALRRPRSPSARNSGA